MEDNPELYGGCAGALVGAIGAWCVIGGLLVANGRLLLVLLVIGVALVLISVLLGVLHAYTGIRGVVVAVIALLLMGGLVAMGTIARYNLTF